MPLSVEQRKEYNKKYYLEHKKELIGKLTAKVECPFCLSVVARNYIETHKMSQICSRKEDRLKTQELRKQQNNII